MKRPLGILFLLVLTSASVRAETTGKDLCKQNFEGYRTRLIKNPDDASAWQELRVCADLLKRWNEAAAIAAEALDNKSKRWEPHFLLGLAHYNTKDFAKAVDEFREAVRLKDDQPTLYFQLGLAYLHLNQPSDAVAAGVRAIELNPTNGAYHRQLAFSYFLINKDDKCEEAAKRAIELDSNDVAAYKILNKLYTRQGKQGMADHMAEEAIHANGRLAAANPFVPDKQVPVEELPQPFERNPPTPTELYLKAQWEKMKEKALAGDVEAAVSYFSSVGTTREVYRQSLSRMGPARMKDVFKKLGELSDCEISTNDGEASCRCPVSGASGTVLETKVRFNQNPDHTWRIKSF